MRFGIVHPGSMGSAVGRAAVGGGHDVLWAGERRSDATRGRALAAGLRDVGTLRLLVAEAGVVISVVPPHGAVEQARRVAGEGFAGLYVDANAVAPSVAREIAGIVTDAGAAYVDGSLVGGPPVARGDTRLYLSGERAGEIASIFDGSALDARVLGPGAFEASAIKMCFAGWTKGTSALLANIQSLARAEGVYQALLAEWGESIPDLPGRCGRLDAGAHEKAWRFIGEMEQIARAFAERGLPAGFHEAATEVYRRIDSGHGRG